MNAVSLRAGLLKTRLVLAGLGWTNLSAGVLFLLGAGTCAILLPGLAARLTDRESALVELQTRLRRDSRQAPVAMAEAPSNLGAFRRALGDIKQAEQAVRTMFAEADRQLLALDQADYKLAYDKAGHFYAYSVQMPVRGSYLAIRIFCEQVLLDLPFASLDDISFKRRGVGETTLDVKLHFTLYLDGPPDYAGGIAATAGRLEGGR